MAKDDFDPYAVLGVDRHASDAEIRAAYRDLGAKYHPDKHQGNPLEGLAAEKMAEANRAYEILSSPAKRSAYDRGERTRPGAAPVRSGRPIRWVRIIGILLLLPLLIRFGGSLVRLLIRVVQGGVELSALARGTPLAAVLFLVVVGFLVYVFVRRRRRRGDRAGGKS